MAHVLRFFCAYFSSLCSFFMSLVVRRFDEKLKKKKNYTKILIKLESHIKHYQNMPPPIHMPHFPGMLGVAQTQYQSNDL